MSFKKAKIALVFDWMTNPGGAEKVNHVLHKMFPSAPIYTSIYNENSLPEFNKAAVTTSFIQHMPFAKSKHQFYVGLMPHAYELFDLSSFDIVISSSHCCAKGVITKPETMHVSYCHSPMRYAWDNWHNYINEYNMNPILKQLGKRRIHKLRMWDRLAAERVDHYIANSSITQKRIKKYYNKESEIINPMIDTSKFHTSKETKGYFLAAGRLTPYKKFDLIVETFNQIGLPLKIVGRGVAEASLKKQAKGNIEFLGYVSDKELKKLYAESEALIFPQVEDFGITAIESMASGRPVIAFKEGGALDSILENETGIFFKKQTASHLKAAIEKYQKQKSKFNSKNIKKHSAQFDEEKFKEKFHNFLEEKWQEWNSK